MFEAAAQILEQRIRHSRKKLYRIELQMFDEFLWVNHVLVAPNTEQDPQERGNGSLADCMAVVTRTIPSIKSSLPERHHQGY